MLQLSVLLQLSMLLQLQFYVVVVAVIIDAVFAFVNIAAVAIVNSVEIAVTCVTSATVVYDDEAANVAAVVFISIVTLVHMVLQLHL